MALRRGLCGLSEGLSCSEEGAYIVPGREAQGCGWPWGDGGVLLSRGEVRGNVLGGEGLCVSLESWGADGGACGAATANRRCVLCGGCLWESGLKGFSALVVPLLEAEYFCSALQVLEQLQPGALGTMLVVELKTQKGVEKKYIIKQVRRRLLGKQESVGTFVTSMGPLIVTNMLGSLATG